MGVYGHLTSSFDYDVIIAGGGPAGASAAIHLSTRGARVLLAEQKKFPRAKLCGEFISPECALHFERLGVVDQILSARPARLTETVFYSRRGKSVDVPSAWFGPSGIALGLSRAEMDERLLRRASDAGAHVHEDAQVTSLLFDDAVVKGVVVKQGGRESRHHAPVTLDATGRTRALARRVEPNGTNLHRAPLVAFKAHLADTRVAAGACEIYFYRGGYGGLSSIETGLSNLCFIASARDVRACGADARRTRRRALVRPRGGGADAGADAPGRLHRAGAGRDRLSHHPRLGRGGRRCLPLMHHARGGFCVPGSQCSMRFFASMPSRVPR